MLQSPYLEKGSAPVLNIALYLVNLLCYTDPPRALGLLFETHDVAKRMGLLAPGLLILLL